MCERHSAAVGRRKDRTGIESQRLSQTRRAIESARSECDAGGTRRLRHRETWLSARGYMILARHVLHDGGLGSPRMGERAATSRQPTEGQQPEWGEEHTSVAMMEDLGQNKLA